MLRSLEVQCASSLNILAKRIKHMDRFNPRIQMWNMASEIFKEQKIIEMFKVGEHLGCSTCGSGELRGPHCAGSTSWMQAPPKSRPAYQLPSQSYYLFCTRLHCTLDILLLLTQ